MVSTKDQSKQCIVYCVCWHCRHWYLCLLHNPVYRANPQFLKNKGLSKTQDSYKAIQQSCILHTLTETACLYKFRSENVLEGWQPGSLWSCSGIGRFSLWHSWLIWAKRLANLAHLRLNVRVPTAPNSLEFNCSYLAAILCAKELNCNSKLTYRNEHTVTIDR